MRILLWHGYLLAGSGSNIYTANLARTWRKHGHDVLVLCQQRRMAGLDFVDAEGDFDRDNRSFETSPTGVPEGPGRCRVLRPSIGAVLPVYVEGTFRGFEARSFLSLTDEELGGYVERNVDALASSIEDHRPEAILVNHEVMGPYIASMACRRAGGEFLALLHGSALEYAVKRQERYLNFASEGLGAAKRVIGGSNYMVEAAARVIPGWRERAVVVNPGCDADLFRPAPVREAGPPLVGFVGALIGAKGVHHLLASLGLVEPGGPRAVVVGSGRFRQGLESLWEALSSGDRAAALEIARRGDDAPLEHLVEFLSSRRADAAYFRRAAGVEVKFTGRMDHPELSGLLPHFEVLVVPSVVPEAFGLVAVEAAACGVLPLVPGHSGIGEVGAALERELGSPGLLTFDPGDPIPSIAERLQALLGLPLRERRELGDRAADLARRRWSWEVMAGRLLELAG